VPQTPTPGRGLIAPALADTADGPDGFEDLSLQLDRVLSGEGGSLADRPPASATVGTTTGSPFTFYWADDTAQLFFSYNGVWIDLSGASGPPIPIGASMEYGGAGDPSDSRFLLEDGRSLLRAGTYAGLFTVLGTTYGSADGTHFSLPDSRGRVTVGPDNMGTATGAAGRLPNSANGRGNTGGEERHLLTSAESGMVAHSHGGATAAMNANAYHTHSIFIAEQTNRGTSPNSFHMMMLGTDFHQVTGYPGDDWGNIQGAHVGGVNIDHLHGIAVQAAASAASAHNVVQPYVVKNKIIRVR
jgi:microcystin-dependent protein